MRMPQAHEASHLSTHQPTAESAALAIHLLGGFRVLVDNQPVPDRAWRLRKAQVLLQVLALAPQHALHREQLMELLWPNLSPDAAARNLHQVLHFARLALRGAPSPARSSKVASLPLVIRRQVVRLQPSGPLWIDTIAFERAAARARQTQTVLAYEQALSLYEGDLMPESPYEDVFAEPRRRLRELKTALLLEKAALEEKAGAWSEALQSYSRVLADDMTMEPAVAGLLRACDVLDARGEAVRYYQGYARHILEDLGLEPDPELQRLFEKVTRRGSAAKRSSRNLLENVERMESSATKPDLRAVTTTMLPLVGRDAELQTIVDALQNTSHGVIFVIAGEAGIGKSRLTQEVWLRGSEAGLPVSAGFGVGVGETPPFGPWRQTLREYAARTGRSLACLPEPLGSGPPAPSTQDLALDVVEFLAGGPPALIVLEDLHWFDPASWELLQHGLPRFRQSRVHLLITCRTLPLPSEKTLGGMVAALIRHGAVWIELQRLGREDIEALARAAGRPERAAPVFERSGGNPFFAVQLLTANGKGLPWTIRQAISERLAMLPERRLDVLRIAALLGREFTAEVLRATSELPGEAVDAVLRDAVSQGIVHPKGRTYVFDHALLRQTLKDSLSPEARAQYHRKAAAVLDDPDAAAYHLGEAGDASAVPLLLAAGRRAMQWGAMEQAHRSFERALELAEEDDPLRAELELLLAVRTDLDQMVGQQQRLERAGEIAARCGDTLVTGLARKLLAEILFIKNDKRSLALFEQALRYLEAAADDPRAERLEALLDRRLLLYPEQPTLMYALHRHRQGVDPVAAAQAAHPRRVSRSGSQEIHLALGFAHCIQGDVLEGIEEITAGGELAMASGSYVTATWCFALALNIRLWQCATDRANIQAVVERMTEAAARSRERTGTDPFPGDYFMMPYWYWYGHWDQVRQVYEAFLRGGGKINASPVSFPYIYGADVLREQGDPQAALSAYAMVLPPDGPDSEPGMIHYLPQMAYITLAIRTMIAAGEMERAQAWLETVDAWHRGPRPTPVIHSWNLIAWAEWYRARGDVEAMRRKAFEALQTARRMPASYVEFNALRLLGAAGGPGAADDLARALDLAERSGFPFDIARARLERGRPDDLAIARGILARLGAKPYLRRILNHPSGARNLC